MSYPKLHWLTHGYLDYRPAIGPDGDQVVFERTPLDHSAHTLLYLITKFRQDPTQFFPKDVKAPETQTRPDWYWKTDKIAFNGVTPHLALHVYLVDAKKREEPKKVHGTGHMAYPTWTRDGKSLVSENHSDSASPKPCNTWFDYPSGSINEANIDGNDSNNVPLFGGMPTVYPNEVGPNEAPLIAFAGQPTIQGWGQWPPPPLPLGPPTYNEDYNYIFINSYKNGSCSSAPMESKASLTKYDPNCQGRAPAWSPGGKKIAFESNRSGGYAIYLWHRDNGIVSGPLTDPTIQAQHAKFFPSGDKLILCGLIPNTSPPARGIAWMNI